MPLAHGLDIVGYEDLGGGAFRVGELVARPFEDNLEWGLGRIEGSLHYPDLTARVARLAVACLQEVEESEQAYTTCTDGRFPLLLLNSRLHPVRPQLLANNIGTAFGMAEMLGEEYYEDPTAPVDERIGTVATAITAPTEEQEQAEPAEKVTAHEDCGGLGNLPTIMTNTVAFSEIEGFRSRTRQSLGHAFNQRIYKGLAKNVVHHLAVNRPYQRYGADIVWRMVQELTGGEGLTQLHDTGPDGIHGHQEKIGLWLGKSITNLALNQRLLSVLGSTNGDTQAFGINQSRMFKIANIIGRGDPELVAKAMHAGVMFTHAGHGTLAYNLPTFAVERA